MNNSTRIAIGGAVITAAVAGGWFVLHRGPAPAAHPPAQPAAAAAEAADGHPYYSCAMHPQVRQDHPGVCPICGMPLVPHHDSPLGAATMQAPDAAPMTPVDDTAGHVLYWYDPMKPEVHFDRPGPSPFMDMALVPKYADAAAAQSGATTVSIDPRMAQNLGIRTALVRSGPAVTAIDAVGRVEIDERRIEVVESRASGWVERLRVRAVGDVVRRGDALADVYAPALLAAREELRLAERTADPALIDAARTRAQLLGASPGQRGAQHTVAVTAPASGVVTELSVREGAQIAPGMPLMKLADLSKVWIVADVPELQSGPLRAGQAAQVTLRALPGRRFDGVVDYVYPTMDEATRTLRLRIVLDNADGSLRPGQYADVRFDTAGGEALLVPSEAVIRTGTRTVVMVSDAPGRYRPAEVVVGVDQDGDTVVVSGLQAGERVVTSGQFLLDSEASLQGAYQRIGAGP